MKLCRHFDQITLVFRKLTHTDCYLVSRITLVFRIALAFRVTLTFRNTLVFRKPTHTVCYLHFRSHHPGHVK